MQAGAAIGSILLHLTGLGMSLLWQPLPDLWARPTDPGWNDATGQPLGRSSLEHRPNGLQLPHILMASGTETGPGYGGANGGPRVRSAAGCGSQRPLDGEAEPEFPIFGDDGPFAALTGTPFSPVFCVRIGADGRVLAVILAATSGDHDADRGLARTIRGLAFRPAARGSHAVSAWYRLAVNRGAGGGWLIDPNPDNVRVERVEMLVPIDCPPQASEAVSAGVNLMCVLPR